MNLGRALICLLTVCNFGCKNEANKINESPEVLCIGAMKDVMWKGELQGKVMLDTLNKKGLYGIGPVEYLQGELLVIDGKSYKSMVTSDSTMQVQATFDVKAPFFVYGNANKWEKSTLPNEIKTLEDLEAFMNSKFKDTSKPFVFKLKGNIEEATIHIQNLPSGTKVTSPKDAHQGQINYKLSDEIVDIIGFYSTKHHGVFTHHDSNMHLHLITEDRSKMGHLDNIWFASDTVDIFLPK